MNKDNILFSIIGVLLGFIFGFFFANTVNERGYSPANLPAATTTTTTAASNSSLPANHPALPSNAVADGQNMQADVQQAIAKARQEPENFDAQVSAAELYYRIGRYDEAIDFLMRANKIKPDNYEVMANLGHTNFEAGRFEVAESWYSRALAQKPDDINVRTYLGATYMLRNDADFDRAIKEFRRALEVDPKHERSLYYLVVALTKKKDAKQAQIAFDKLSEVNPQNPDLQKLRAEIDGLQ